MPVNTVVVVAAVVAVVATTMETEKIAAIAMVTVEVVVETDKASTRGRPSLRCFTPRNGERSKTNSRLG